MKTIKRTMGALAFLAAFLMVASVMAPLADAGATDSSAPVLFSKSENSSDADILRTWTNEEDGIELQYAHTVYEGYDAYGILVYFKTILNEFTLGSTLYFKLIGPNSFNVEDQVSRGSNLPYLPLQLGDALALGTYTLTISDNKAQVRPVSTTTFTLGAVITNNIAGYEESAENAKTAINSVWNGEEDITDIDDKTMYVIYEQTGIFNDAVIGKLYFNGNEIYTEPLINQEGQRIWYFSFAEGAPAKLHNMDTPGEYTLSIISDSEVVAEKTVTIEEQPEQPSLSILDQGYGETKEEALNQISAAWGISVDDIISNTMWVMFSQTGEFNTLMGELYLNDATPLYSENLTASCDASKSGNKLWYFSFDDQASAVTPIPGIYTLKIVGDNEIIAETTVTIVDPKPVTNDFRLEIKNVMNTDEAGDEYGFEALLISNDDNYLPKGTLAITYMVSFFDENNNCYAVVKCTESRGMDCAETHSLSIFPLNDGEMLVSGFAEFTYITPEGTEETVTTETILAK